MCIATPVKVKKVKGDKAVVDALGETLEVDTSLVKGVGVGDYLLAKGSLAIQKLAPQEAEEILKLVKSCNHHEH